MSDMSNFQCTRHGFPAPCYRCRIEHQKNQNQAQPGTQPSAHNEAPGIANTQIQPPANPGFAQGLPQSQHSGFMLQPIQSYGYALQQPQLPQSYGLMPLQPALAQGYGSVPLQPQLFHGYESMPQQPQQYPSYGSVPLQTQEPRGFFAFMPQHPQQPPGYGLMTESAQQPRGYGSIPLQPQLTQGFGSMPQQSQQPQGDGFIPQQAQQGCMTQQPQGFGVISEQPEQSPSYGSVPLQPQEPRGFASGSQQSRLPQSQGFLPQQPQQPQGSGFMPQQREQQTSFGSMPQHFQQPYGQGFMAQQARGQGFTPQQAEQSREGWLRHLKTESEEANISEREAARKLQASQHLGPIQQANAAIKLAQGALTRLEKPKPALDRDIHGLSSALPNVSTDNVSEPLTSLSSRAFSLGTWPALGGTKNSGTQSSKIDAYSVTPDTQAGSSSATQQPERHRWLYRDFFADTLFPSSTSQVGPKPTQDCVRPIDSVTRFNDSRSDHLMPISVDHIEKRDSNTRWSDKLDVTAVETCYEADYDAPPFPFPRRRKLTRPASSYWPRRAG